MNKLNIINNYTNMIENYANKKAISIIDEVINNSINFMKKKIFKSYITSSNCFRYNNLINFLKKISKKSKKYITTIDNNVPILIGLFTINTHKNCIIIVNGYKNNFHYNFEDNSDIYNIEILFYGKGNLKIYNKFLNFMGLNKENNEYNKNDIIASYDIVAKNSSDWYSYRDDCKKRKFDSYFLDDNIKKEIVTFIKNWESNKEIFNKKGLKYKTGLLLYGAPGTGKSTLAHVLASEFNFTLVNIDTATFDDLNLTEVSQAINNEYGKVLVFIDEIDVLFKSRDEKLTDEENKRVTKLLQFLDGSVSPDNVLFVATTNYIDRLDKAILRKGRFDKIIELCNISKQKAFEMCKSFNLSDKDTEIILKKYNTSSNINPSELQNDIIQFCKE